MYNYYKTSACGISFDEICINKIVIYNLYFIASTYMITILNRVSIFNDL